MIRSFFDTNVLVYLFDAGAPEKQKRAAELFEGEVRAARCVLSTQILQEFFVTVTRKLAKPLPVEEAERAVRDFSTLPLVQIDGPMVLAGIGRSRTHGFSLWDSLVIEAAIAGGAGRLYSEDLQDGQRIDGLEIVDPFRHGDAS